MRVYCVSDIHTDYKENLEWIVSHGRATRERKNSEFSVDRPRPEDDDRVLLVAGDVCDDVATFRKV